jgi:hypothetical protein
MAFLPDQAIEDLHEVGTKAFTLYAIYCKFGGMKNNRVHVGLKTLSRLLGMSYDRTTGHNATLKRKGWIKTEDNYTILLKGFGLTETSVETYDNVSSNLRKRQSELTETSVETYDNVSSNLPKRQSEIPTRAQLTETSVETYENVSPLIPSETPTYENVSPELTKTSVAYKEEPALLNQQEKNLTHLELNTTSEAESEKKTWEEFLKIARDGICKELKVSAIPNESRWLPDLRWAWTENYQPEQVVEVFEILNRQEARRFPVTAANIAASLPHLEKLRGENSNWQSVGKADETADDEPEQFQAPAPVEPKPISLTAEDRAVWQEMQRFIESKVGKQVHDDWFSKLHPAQIDRTNGTVVIESTEIAHQWIRTYYRNVLEAALHSAGLQAFTVDWRPIT